MIRQLLVRYLSFGWALHAAAVLGYMAAIFLLSSSEFDPFFEEPFLQAFLFNFAHVPLYLGLSVLVALMTRRMMGLEAGNGRAFAWIAATCLIVVAFGVSDEYHQSFTGRTPAALDIVSDAVGTLLGVLFVARVLDGRPSRPVFWGACAGLLAAAVAAVYGQIA